MAAAESLDRMQQHLTAAGGTNLDLSHLERFLALRPMLSLKLGPKVCSDKSWCEWKLAAVAVAESNMDDLVIALMNGASLFGTPRCGSSTHRWARRREVLGLAPIRISLDSSFS